MSFTCACNLGFLAMVLATSVAAVVAVPTVATHQQPVGILEQLKAECTEKNDGLACIQFKLLNLIAQARSKDVLKVTESVTVVKNDEPPKNDHGRGFTDQLENYVQTHDMLVRLPFTDATISVSPRNLDNNELSLSLRYPESDVDNDVVEGKSRRRKNNKLKKILVPIVVFVLLKALTLVPLAIGILGLKAWNALHLSFFSFVVSIALAIFQVAKKITSDQAAASLHAAPWESYNQYAAVRSFGQQAQDLDAQQLAYSAHSQ